MKIACYGDSLTEGVPGVSYLELLRKALPEQTIINYGKGGDTVHSLYDRIVTRNLLEPVDLAFVWIGANDAFVHVARHFSLIKRLLRQLWARTPEEFNEYYANILNILNPCAGKIVSVSPFLVGEDLQNRWNRQLEQFCQVIQQCSKAHANVTYCDLRAKVAQELGSQSISPYISRSALRVAWDYVLYKTPMQIDRVSSDRGLHLTFDGVHLNSRGATLVVDTFGEIIQGYNTHKKEM